MLVDQTNRRFSYQRSAIWRFSVFVKELTGAVDFLTAIERFGVVEASSSLRDNGVDAGTSELT